MTLKIIILAAGEGKRMHSALPKCLHQLAGKPLLQHVIETAKTLKPEDIYVVYGHRGEALREAHTKFNVHWIEQTAQLGTGHAVSQVLPNIKMQDRVLILFGDVPLIKPNTLKHLIKHTPKDHIGWLTANVDDPIGMGRIIRDNDGHPKAIVEERDTSTKQKKIQEINTGICISPGKYLKKWLPKLENKNAQKEYYLTDIFEMAVSNQVGITTTQPHYSNEILGANDHVQLAQLERIYQKKLSHEYMSKGLTLLDPNRFDVRGELFFGKDVVIDINVIIEGKVEIGANSYIGPNTILRNTKIGKHTHIDENSLIDRAIVGNDCKVGPYARLRPGTKLANQVKIGNFVEIKQATIDKDTKINHLSYIGDAVLGKHINVGAGTITCNHDGAKKHITTIEDHAFIGSNSAFVAPITIGKNATIGAGSVITANAPRNKLTLARIKQITIKHWKRPQKNSKEN